MNRPGTKKGFSVLGVGAAACAACCVGPVLGLLAAAGLFTVAGVAIFGLAGLVVLVPAALWWHRRPPSPSCTIPDEPVPVALSGGPGPTSGGDGSG